MLVGKEIIQIALSEDDAERLIKSITELKSNYKSDIKFNRDHYVLNELRHKLRYELCGNRETTLL